MIKSKEHFPTMIKFLASVCFLGVILDFTTALSIYRDTDVRKIDRRGKDFGDLSYYDEYPAASTGRRRYTQPARWESAEWPQQRDDEEMYESAERPYSWFYYNKYLTNGRFNHLYNGPQVDDTAGMEGGNSGNGHNKPHILPPPSSASSGRTFKGWNRN